MLVRASEVTKVRISRGDQGVQLVGGAAVGVVGRVEDIADVTLPGPLLLLLLLLLLF